MARKRISEFRAKTLLYQELDARYTGIQVNGQYSIPEKLDSSKQYVLKVDQGVKGRFKKGLVLLNQTVKQIPQAVKELQTKGYSQFLLEEMTNHLSADEKYLSIERTREGYKVLYSESGGIDIEQHQNTMSAIVPFYSPNNPILPDFPNLPKKFLQTLLGALDKYYLSFLEINPFILHNSNFILLDAAVEVDSTAAFFVNNVWTETDFTDTGSKLKTEEEINVQDLAAKSQAAFSLEVLNRDGSIFMMLSGGGASIVLADEAYNQGYGKQLANYGEYSGNPNAEETYIYAQNLISLLLKSKALKKVLIIAGGVANFTDIRITFNGLIKALTEKKLELQKQNIKVFVRRGGPYQDEGLMHMNQFLKENNLLGTVSGPEMVLTDIVTEAIKLLH